MNRRHIIRLGIVIAVVVCAVVGWRVGRINDVLAEGARLAGLRQAHPQRLAAAELAAPAHGVITAGGVVTQTFELQAGWNAIYLEVEPINDSPLIDVGTAEEPILVPELSTIQAVFDDLPCGACLESVWTWNVPLTTADYIVDPAEGLWDAPGWKRYFPQGSLGAEGESLAFLTDLFSLSANKAYLVKLKDGAGPVTLTVAGHPRVERHHWLADSYNLAGFPVDPDAVAPVAVGTFFHDLAGGASAISEVRRLNADGTWSEPLTGGDSLNYGEGYLVYFDGGDPDAVADYTAPLAIISTVGDGLEFTSGFAGNKQSVQVENLSNRAISVQLQALEPAQPAVALQFDADSASDVDPLLPLWPNPAQISLEAGKAAALHLVVPSAQQTRDGQTLLAVSSPELGARWLVPVSASQGDLAGLWIGEAVVNDVSEGRLGGTNVDSGELTIALHPRDLSGQRGAAQWVELPAGNTASVALTATLSLPAPEEILPLQAISATTPYVAGYVFIDSNQNGQRDADEQGLPEVTVQLGGISMDTDEEGLYLFDNVTPGPYSLALSAPPAGYTADFPIVLPETASAIGNAAPTSVVVGVDGSEDFEPEAYRRQILAPPYTLPQYDANDSRVEPLLNFGFVPIYDVSLWTGQCADRWEKRRDLDAMLNGVLLTTLNRAALNPGYDVDDLLIGSPPYVLYIEQRGAGGTEGKGIACGEIVVGAPTHFANGDGSDFRFRLLLRVNEHGDIALLPDYVTPEGKRVSSANFSVSEPVTATGSFTGVADLLNFSIVIGPDDPLNPYKHKYHPDHDNLDVKFNAIDFNIVPPYLWESYEVRRRIQLALTELPPVAGATALTAAELDWGGGVWGGWYKEVIEGIHKNDITVKGYFVIRHALMWEDLTPQAYDLSGGGGG